MPSFFVSSDKAFLTYLKRRNQGGSDYTVSRAVVEGSAGQVVEGRFVIGRAFLVSVRKVVVARGREHKRHTVVALL